ncbi:AfsR/SARP family transcriptional regulator [Amycolatopsis sp. WQ 127309]|uniref:AfsR/SARP family transcriptional regulator n=1 Tax=Amycolatopsis sp. WQ 127309 TaxID=2932773 RepID=UPI001FF4BA99|nr:AfsR/SARP family transcriptional regulator [Amycolatopsis sp. WQ 127309]UOZ03097.1 tetratricopeptide repeat protein [Amycolatopsis sp. WQ 127309]
MTLGEVSAVLRLLGEVAASVDGAPVDLGHPRQRCVLAALVVERGRVVSTDRLAERVWGAAVPLRGRETVHSYISRLRRAVSAVPGVSLVRRSGGYALIADATPLPVDLYVFQDLCARAGADSDDARVVSTLTEALALWHGPALTGLTGDWADAERDRLERARLAAQLDLAETRLRLGEGTELVAGLAALAAGHPYDERIAGLYMTALHRAGRTADALQHYREVHARLSEDLGIDPTAALVDTHRRLLGRDREARPPGGAGKTPARRNCLPRDLPDFTGRAAELARLATSTGDRATVYSVDGMAGVGKTAFAVHAGHLLAGRFPDGVVFVDLQGHSAGKTPLTADEALEVLLGQLGLAATGDAKAQWRAKTAALRLLVVFDNAVDETQVAALLPAGPGLVIVTSRARLPDLAGARPISLAVLPEEEATAFFARLVGTDRAAAEPEAVARIVRLCAGLPLALRLSGARLAHRTAWPIAYLSAQLADARRRLPKLFADREVALAFRMSHEHLPPEDQQLFYALGRHPGADADTAVLAAMTGTPVGRADDALQRLVDVHLAEEAVPGRYRQHDLLRQYARGLSDDPRMTGKMLDHYLAAVTDAAACFEAGGPEAAAAHAWLLAERGNLLAATRCAAAEGYGTHAWQLAISFWHFLERDLGGDPIELLEQSLAAAQETAEGGEGLLSTLLALAHWSAGHTSRAFDLLTASAKQPENTESHAHTLALLGLMHLQRGDHEPAARHAQAAADELAVLARLSPLGLDARIITCWTRGVVRWLNGDYEPALAFLRTAYAGCEELGRFSPNDHVLTALARCLIALGDGEEALGHLRQARDLRQRIGDREGEAEALVLIGTAHRAAGRAHDALGPQRAAVTMLDDDVRLQACARIELGRTLLALGNGTEAVEQFTIVVRGEHLHERAQAHAELARTGDDPSAARDHERAAADIAARLDLDRPKSLPHLRPAGW